MSMKKVQNGRGFWEWLLGGCGVGSTGGNG
jgi:hypothetical protein